MTTQDKITLLGILVALLAPILTILISKWIENKDFPSVGSIRNLTGKWKGSTIQDNERDVKITCLVKSKKKTISGTATIVWEKDQSMELKIKGHFLDENHIHIDYRPVDSNIKNFGSQILRISSSGNKLEGLTIGYGSEQEHIISGKTTLNKAT